MCYLKSAVVVISIVMMTSVSAEEARFTLPSLGDQEAARWRAVSYSMAHNEYGDAVRHNKRIVQRATTKYLEGELVSLGMSKQAVGVAGATVGFLIDGGKLSLNDSKTLSMEVRDVVDSERVMLFKYKLNW